VAWLGHENVTPLLASRVVSSVVQMPHPAALMGVGNESNESADRPVRRPQLQAGTIAGGAVPDTASHSGLADVPWGALLGLG
jgi:hypothetical protein